MNAQDENKSGQEINQFLQPDQNQKLIGSYLINSKGQEVILPQFKTLEEFEDLVPKAIKKQLQVPFEQRSGLLKNELEEEGQQETPILLQSNSNKSESAFMHQLLMKEQFKEVSCQFQNDYFLTFQNKPDKDDITKRAQIFAKTYVKNNLQSDRNKVEQEMNIGQKISEENEDHERSIILNQNKSLAQFYQRQESIEQDNNEQNQEILQRIDQLYFSLCQVIEDKIFQLYQYNMLDECIIWKERKENLEADMLKISDNHQLLKIIELFKFHYNL